ncbi:u1 zinc finger domain-containing protein [Colletotrichum karsti]|uniref:U1 zinc finger domain-containing protein n=1 Tax=Colletotrichum karsti TaxID=1095194 RepID=A0A9P6IBZ5_9PEZI|nr:u1 zinc finger domain-containing protein [Colletotrichum karsti]KAF9880587.1 u1 zinc finger domain-containing protein [Colletotrichum karsti]
MSEYWKSTPKYWCKHCSIFVRDTKLERQNHEATGKHQGALKRFLRDLHRGHEQEERDKDRARREVERVKGVAAGSSSSTSFSKPGSSAPAPASSSESSRKQQMEQLAEMGVSIPTAFRGDMAMPGEWTVTTTKVVDDDATKEKPVEAKAIGVRKKREQTEEEKEEEDAVRGLFKKPRKWGGMKTMPEDDKELDALLSGDTLFRPKKEESAEPPTKTEDDVKREEGADEAAPEAKLGAPAIKAEDDEAGVKLDVPEVGSDADAVKKEDGVEATETAAPAVVFKKRKPKNIRQK